MQPQSSHCPPFSGNPGIIDPQGNPDNLSPVPKPPPPTVDEYNALLNSYNNLTVAVFGSFADTHQAASPVINARFDVTNTNNAIDAENNKPIPNQIILAVLQAQLFMHEAVYNANLQHFYGVYGRYFTDYCDAMTLKDKLVKMREQLQTAGNQVEAPANLSALWQRNDFLPVP